MEPTRSSSIASRSAEPEPSTRSWPTNSSTVFGRSRVASGATCGMRSRAASQKRSLTAESMLRPGSVTEVEDFSEPILPGTAASDYERYLRTDELLALQKSPEELSHRDELLFMTVHQSSELWLKLAAFEVETAVGLLQDGELGGALRLLRRAHDCMKNVIGALDMLEHLSPWEYTAFVRPLLGHGSGFDSPGFREVRRVSPMLGEVFHRLRRDAGLSIEELYLHGREHE